MPETGPNLRVRQLAVVLTASCNLACSYCFQNRKNSARMTEGTLRKTLDLALSTSEPEIKLVFLGGEPLLQFPRVEFGVSYVEARRPADKTVRYAVVTNGTRIDDDVAAFLVRYDFETQISFDGVPAAQALRGGRTFAQLDALLGKLRREYPAFYKDRVNLSATVTPQTVPYLADSVDYFLDQDVAEFSIAPIFTDASRWPLEDIHVLDDQFRKIYRSSLRYYRETGRVPFSSFRVAPGASRPPRPARLSMCGVSRGEFITADLDGSLHGCLTFAGSFQKADSTFLDRHLENLRIGSVDDVSPAAVERYREAAVATGLFEDKQDKYSSYQACADCRYLATCAICPISIGHIPGNEDPRRVPDFGCAFHMTVSKYRELFPETSADGRRVEERGLGGDRRSGADHFARIRRAAARLS